MQQRPLFALLAFISRLPLLSSKPSFTWGTSFALRSYCPLWSLTPEEDENVGSRNQAPYRERFQEKLTS